jgi:hypothetical protein
LSEKNESFMHLDVGPYIGQWVCVYDKKVVSHSRSYNEAYLEAKKVCGDREPFVALVPSDHAIIL